MIKLPWRSPSTSSRIAYCSSSSATALLISRHVFETQKVSHLRRGSFIARVTLNVLMRLTINLQSVVGEDNSIINSQLQLDKYLFRTDNRSFLVTKLLVSTNSYQVINRTYPPPLTHPPSFQMSESAQHSVDKHPQHSRTSPTNP